MQARALVEVLITWRNNTLHDLADNKVSQASRDALAQHAADIRENYRGLIVEELADKAEAGASLTFKETASLINAAHEFVKEVDSRLLASFDQRRFCVEAVQDAL